MRKLKNAELNRLDVDSFKQAPKSPLVLVLDNVRSTHNVGSIFRTADAFRVQEILLCGITATPPHRDIRKTALGATESVQWQYCENTIDAIQNLQSKGVVVLAIEQAAVGFYFVLHFNQVVEPSLVIVDSIVLNVMARNQADHRLNDLMLGKENKTAEQFFNTFNTFFSKINTDE